MEMPKTLEAQVEFMALEDARESFWAFRQLINPRLKKGWWQREIAYELQNFYCDLIDGKRPKLVIQAPPQHGKSIQIIDFVAWVAGHNPDFKTIYTSFSERLGVRANLRLQRIFDSVIYKKCFPETRINDKNTVTISGQYLRNREIVEYVNHEGYFRNTTVRGSITGETLDLGVIDDPIKGREEAGSLTVRDKTWDWLMDDFFTRFSEHAGLLTILTRWHIDDPIGRLIKAMPDVRVLSYPALATRDEIHRRAGEPLFPELKSKEFLMLRKQAMFSGHWEALYQQNPLIEGGEIIKNHWFKRYDILPIIKYRKIFCDTAEKIKTHNDYSVFECWGLGEDNKLYLIDMIRGKWEIPDLRRRFIDFWNKHNSLTKEEKKKMGALRGVLVEDESSGTQLIQDIRRDANIPIKGILRVKDKLNRVNDVLSYIESGYVYLPANAPFTNDFIAECEAFTGDDTHAHDDQIDPMCDAIVDMLGSANKVEIWKRIN